MRRIRIIKKNDEYSPEYGIGDIFEITGTWYGGVHIKGRSGVPVSLDREEYTEIAEGSPETSGPGTELRPEEVSEGTERTKIQVGDIIQHFKRELVPADTSQYLYKVLAFAQHTETGEKLVVYQALYAPFSVYARPYDLFMGKTDREKYPQIRQAYRFEKVKG